MGDLSSETKKRQHAAVQVADVYRRLPGVVVLFAWGSTATGRADSSSDIDFGVYVRGKVPSEEARRAELIRLVDNPNEVRFTKFGRLEAVDRLSVQSLPVFVAWWDVDKEVTFLRSRLDRLLDNLDDGLAENELGEIQRSLVLGIQKGFWLESESRSRLT